jgi:hypothetical protein
MQPKQPKRRRRGVILTQRGLDRFLTAKATAEFQDNGGRRYTLESLSERTNLAVDTLVKVMACETGVDKQTLKCCFNAFNLNLEALDYTFPDNFAGNPEAPPDLELDLKTPDPPLPGGQVPLKSEFYIARSELEENCFKAILRPGALIRIKGARRTGKSSLSARIADYATQYGYHAISLSFQLAEKEVFQDLTRLLRWFCAGVSVEGNISPDLDKYWDDLFGSKISCKIYFEQHLLAATQQPIVLVLDDVDHLFEYPALADDFFGLLRAWHEEAKNREIWQKLRLIVAHTTEVYIPLNVNKSPFNVGFPVELPEFNPDQIQLLAQRYQIAWSIEEAETLNQLLGGQPYLIQLALYHLWCSDSTLDDFLHPKTTVPDIFQDHLQRQLWSLQQQPALVKALTLVIAQANPVELPLPIACELQTMGLVKLYDNRATISCQLYANYFAEQLLK